MTDRAWIASVVCVALLFEGCVGSGGTIRLTPLSADAGPFAGPYTWPSALAVDGRGAPLEGDARVAALSHAAYAVEQLVPGSGGEPNIGVTSSGNLFVTAYAHVLRSSDHGLTWREVEDLRPPDSPITENQMSTSDPMLWVDPDTDRVFDDQMYPALLCTWLSWSDHEGNNGTWTERPFDCGVPYLDHQKLMTAHHGPEAPLGSVRSPLYPNVVYLCVNKVQLGTWCAVSLDGGASFAYDREVYPPDQACGNINGHPAAFPDGTVALVLGNSGADCKRPLTIALTEDDGLTWSIRQCDASLSQVEVDADLTVTPDGTAYVFYRDQDQIVHLLRSTDKFATCESFRVAPPDQTLDVFTGITSGDDGRVALAWLGTRTLQTEYATPSNATPGTVWQLFTAVSLDAESDSPSFTVTQATPNEDPAQIGCVWLDGGPGGPRGCRNLLDFIDVTHDADGRFYVAFTDGCVPRIGCTAVDPPAGMQSRASQVGVAVEDHGPSLFTSKGDVLPLGLEPPAPPSA